MYTEEETEQFRDVLYTTKDDEVAGWIRSLQLRGIDVYKRQISICSTILSKKVKDGLKNTTYIRFRWKKSR